MSTGENKPLSERLRLCATAAGLRGEYRFTFGPAAFQELANAAEALERERDTLRTERDAAHEAIRKLTVELNEWTLEECREGIGNTNVAVIRTRRDEAAALLSSSRQKGEEQ